MKLQIKSLSPLHIGNGEKYNGLSYISNRGEVLFYDSINISENITPQYSKRFMEWIEQRSGEVEQLEKKKRNEKNEQKRKDINRLLRDAQRKLSLKEFTENATRDVNIRSKFNKNFLYAIEAKSQVYDNIDIDCFIKQNNKPYIPGTEIKGAIRTAILYALLNKESSLWDEKSGLLADEKANKLIESIRAFGNKHRANISKAGNKRLERWMKDEKKIKEKLLVEQMKEIQKQLQVKLLHANNNNDAKYDMLKLLHISDTELKEPNSCLFVSNLNVEGISKGFPLFQELCKKDQTFTCYGFKLDNNKTILDKLGFSDEQKWIVSDIKNHFQCCYEFTNKLLDEELKYPNYPQKVKDKLTVIKQQNKPENPVIRIGKNEGYLSLTMGLLVKDKDKYLYDNVLCHATKNTSYTGNFPKTRRVVNLENGDVDTCGWVKLICQ